MRRVLIAFAVAVAVVLGAAQTDIANAQSPPPLPMLYSGTASAGGSSVPDGFEVVARVRDYQSEPIVVANGRYTALTVGPPDATYAGETITFHMDGVQADQTDTFIAAFLPTIRTTNLTFPGLPQPTPTATVPPTATPTVTPTPVVALPSVYSGLIIVAAGSVPADAELVARVGGYESLPAAISGEVYRSLVVDPGDTSLIGETISFFLNGIESRTTDTYVSNQSSGDFDLVFVGVPTPTPTPTATQVPSTPTPTATPVPPVPTSTALPPSPTPTPTTAATPRPTETPIPPSPTATTPAPLEPTATPTPAGGGCFASVDAPVASGLANVLLMVAPLALIAGYRRYQRRELLDD